MFSISIRNSNHSATIPISNFASWHSDALLIVSFFAIYFSINHEYKTIKSYQYYTLSLYFDMPFHSQSATSSHM